MKTLDDHYRKIAQQNSAHRSFKDVIANNTDSNDIRSRNYSAKLARAKDDGTDAARFDKATLDKWALEVECPECASPIGCRCVSLAKKTPGMILDNPHASRSSRGFAKHRK